MISIVNNYFDKLKTLNNNYELEFNDELYIDFNKKLLNYDVNKNSKLTNSKVCFILKLNLDYELNNLSKQYISACIRSDDPEISKKPTFDILFETNEYIKYKYDKYMKNHPKFKIISDIETKYNFINAGINNIVEDNAEDRQFYDNFIIIQ